MFEIEHNSTHDARVGISRDAFQVMQKNSYCNKALVAFIPKGSNQYRFSFLQIDNEIILTQDDTLIYSEKVLVVIPQISFYLGKVELKTVRI